MAHKKTALDEIKFYASLVAYSEQSALFYFRERWNGKTWSGSNEPRHRYCRKLVREERRNVRLWTRRLVLAAKQLSEV